MQLGVVGILFVYFFLDKIDTITEKELPWFGEPNQLALFFGMVIFSFDGVTVILPVHNCMKFPNDMLGMTGVLNISMGGVCPEELHVMRAVGKKSKRSSLRRCGRIEFGVGILRL